MKQFFTLIAAMLMTLSIFAQQDEAARRRNSGSGKITISSLTGAPVRILVDGRNYNSQGKDNDVTISDLRQGYHTIKIYLQKNNRYGGKRNNNSTQLVYDATIAVRAQYHVDIVINRFGKVFVDERQMNAAYYADYDDDYGNGNGNGYNNGYNNSWNNISAAQMMNTSAFNQFKQTLRNESFDNTRLVIAKQTIANNYFSAAQVKELADLFSFENSKLEIAEYAYRYTIDKNNYFLLNEALTYTGSKEELARYINAYR